MTDLQTSDYPSTDSCLPIFSSSSPQKATDEEGPSLVQSQESGQEDGFQKRLSHKKALQPKAQESSQADTASEKTSFASTWSQWEKVKRLSRETTRITLLNKEPELINARQALVLKKVKGGITHQEETELEYINWQLNKIDDAKFGESLDCLQKLVEVHEIASREVGETVSAIKAIALASNSNRPRRWKNR